MSRGKEILRQTWVYSAGTQLAQLITLAAAVFSRRFLGPTQTGIWTTLQILVDYSKYSTLGTMDAVSREIPYRIGKGDTAGAEKTKNLAASFVLSGSFTIALLVAGFAFVTAQRFRPEITNGLYLVAAIIFLQRLNNLLVALLRCYKLFEIETRLMVASAVVNAVLVGVLSFAFKIYGFLLALILSLAFNIIFVRRRHAFHFRWNYSVGDLRPLVSYGLPLMALGFGTTLLRSLDRIVIAKFLGFQELGFYSIALMTVSYLSNFPVSIGIVLLPHFQEKFGETDRPEHLAGYLEKAARAFTLALPVVISLSLAAVPYAVKLFLPQFLPGLPAMRILALSIFFLALAQIYYDTLVTVKRHLRLFPVLAGAVLITFGLTWGAARLGWGTAGVAGAATASFGIYFFLLHQAARAAFGNTRGLFSSFAVFTALAGFTALLAAVEGKPLFEAVLLALFCLPFLFLLNREFRVLTVLKERFFTRKNP